MSNVSSFIWLNPLKEGPDYLMQWGPQVFARSAIVRVEDLVSSVHLTLEQTPRELPVCRLHLVTGGSFYLLGTLEEVYAQLNREDTPTNRFAYLPPSSLTDHTRLTVQRAMSPLSDPE